MPFIHKTISSLTKMKPCFKPHFRRLSKSMHFMEKFEVINEEQFLSSVLENRKPTLVEFTAPWCVPCNKVVSRIEAVVDADEVNVAKIDMDTMSDFAQKYNVSAIPCLLGVKDGQIVARLEGIQNEESISNLVRKISQ